MRKHKERRPRWALLYGMVAAIAGALYLESKLPISGTARIIAQLAVLGIACYLIFLWNESNLPFDPWS